MDIRHVYSQLNTPENAKCFDCSYPSVQFVCLGNDSNSHAVFLCAACAALQYFFFFSLHYFFVLLIPSNEMGFRTKTTDFALGQYSVNEISRLLQYGNKVRLSQIDYN